MNVWRREIYSPKKFSNSIPGFLQTQLRKDQVLIHMLIRPKFDRELEKSDEYLEIPPDRLSELLKDDSILSQSRRSDKLWSWLDRWSESDQRHGGFGGRRIPFQGG